MISAIIQARMASTRLPGKVLKKVLGKPLLKILIHQLSAVKKINHIIVATTTDHEDVAIVEFCQKNNIAVYRGPKDDVLERYYQAAKKFKVKNIMRITADCPLLDPKICNALIDEFISQKADYAYMDQMFAEGLDCEIFSMDAFSRVYRVATKKAEREHVTLYFKNYPKKFKIICLKNQCDDSRFRITVDEPEDFKVVKTIIKALDKGDSSLFSFDDVKGYLINHTHIFQMNSHILRNEGLVKSLINNEEFVG